jgi:low affinity Fe/Cu permease
MILNALDGYMACMPRPAEMPSDVAGDMTVFDRFAGASSMVVSRAPFFAFCLLLIIVWAPTLAFLKFDTWQLLINTATTIITFLMVALLQNSQTRNDQATQHKLNAIADGLADLMSCFAEEHDLHRDIEELKLAVGLEEAETTAHSHKPGDANRNDAAA